MTWYDQNPRFLGCGYEGSKFPRKFEQIEKACKIRESWNSRVVYSVALWLALSALSPLIQRTLLLSPCIGVSFNCNVPRSTRQSRLVRLKPGSRPQLIDSSPGYIVSSTDFNPSRSELIVNRTNNDCWALPPPLIFILSSSPLGELGILFYICSFCQKSAPLL